MSWILLSITSVVIFSITTILQKSHATKKLNHTVITGSLYHIVSGVIILIFSLVTSSFALKYTDRSIILTLAAIVFFTFGTWAFFRAIYLLNASVLAVIMTLRAVVTTILAIIILGETVHTSQYIGMVLVITSIVLSQSMQKLRLKLEGLALALFASLLFGVGNLFERIVVKEMNIYLYLVPAFIVPGVLLFVFQSLNLKGKSVTLSKITTSHILIVGSLTALGAILAMVGISLAPTAGQYAFVTQSRVIFVAIFAYIFLQDERGNIKRRLFAALLCMLGLILLA